LNLVTGATGIVGSHVVLTLLQNNQSVVACKQRTSDVKKTEELFSYYTDDYKHLFEKIKWVEVDLCDVFSIEDAMKGITNVYHCAGLVSFNTKDQKKLTDINEQGTKNVVNACLSMGIEGMCHVSSVATINNLDYTLPLNEDVFWKTSGKESDYAISKYNAEREVWRGIEEGLNAVIVNPGVILSPGFWSQSSSKLFEACYKGNYFYTEGTAAYIGAKDVAEIMIQLVSKQHFSKRYILVEDNYTYHNILGQIQSQFNQPKPKIKASRLLLDTARVLEAFMSVFTRKEKKLSNAIINAAFNKQLFSKKRIKEDLGVKLISTRLLIEQICHYHTNIKSEFKPSL
jgi:dihydroflavonol-4-reductase